MQDRYIISSSRETIEERFEIDATEAFEPKFNCAPTHLLPVVTNKSPKGFSFFYWGLLPDMANGKSLSTRLYNTKSEALKQKKAVRNNFAKQRCIIIANGFYVWKKISKKRKVPYLFSLEDKQPFAIAGLWEEFEDLQGNMNHAFTMITTAPNDAVAEMTDDMPAILEVGSEKQWLTDEFDEKKHLDMITTIDSNKFSSYSVSPAIQDINTDSPSLIQHIPPADQLGNYTLFE